MTGRIREGQKAGGKQVTVDVATFRVRAVAERTSQADLLEVGPGWTIAAALEVIFDQATSSRRARSTASLGTGTPPPSSRKWKNSAAHRQGD